LEKEIAHERNQIEKQRKIGFSTPQLPEPYIYNLIAQQTTLSDKQIQNNRNLITPKSKHENRKRLVLIETTNKPEYRRFQIFKQKIFAGISHIGCTISVPINFGLN